MPTWTVTLTGPAQKALHRAPRHDQERLRAALRELAADPRSGDFQALKNQPTAFRRRVGEWRIFFDLYPDRLLILVSAVERRTSTTYRRRR